MCVCVCMYMYMNIFEGQFLEQILLSGERYLMVMMMVFVVGMVVRWRLFLFPVVIAAVAYVVVYGVC